MQSGFAAVSARPFWFRTDETHSSAVGLVMHAPVRAEKHFDIFFSEEVWRGVRAVEDANLPVIAVGGNQVCRNTERLWLRLGFGDGDNVACAERCSGETTEFAEHEGTFRAEKLWGVDAAADSEVGSRSSALYRAETQDVAFAGVYRLPTWCQLPVQLCVHIGAGNGEDCVAVETQVDADGCHLEGRCAFFISYEPVGDAEGECVHWPGRRHADVPVAEA